MKKKKFINRKALGGLMFAMLKQMDNSQEKQTKSEDIREFISLSSFDEIQKQYREFRSKLNGRNKEKEA